MFPPAPPADAARRWVRGLASAALLALAGCASQSTATAKDATSRPAVLDTPKAAALRGSGPGQPCHSAAPPSAADEPVVRMPKVAPGAVVVSDLRVGTGRVARVGHTILVQYVGIACSTGTQFDATWDRGEPIALRLAKGGVIDGWLAGIPGMRVGGLRRVVVPPAFGYREEGFRKLIRPGETLVFVVELVAVR